MNYINKRKLGIFIITALVLSALLPLDSTAAEKWHPLKNYSVEYKMEGVSSGTKNHYSQQYGNLVCWVEVSEIKMPGAPTQKKNEKIITQIKDGQQWIITINRDDNTGTKMKNPMFEGIAKNMEGKSPQEFSEEFMKQLGGKEVGEKTVNGEKCKVWELMGGARTCITPDQITVETAVDMAGISMKETAVKVSRNDSGPDGICEVGDAKLKEVDMSQMLGQ